MKRQERFIAMASALGGAAIMVYAWRSLTLGEIAMPDAGLLPFLAGAALAVLSILWALLLPGEAAPGPAAGPTARHPWLRPLKALLLMLLYAWAMETLGYITSTLLFTVAWQQVIERATWLRTAAISLLATAAMYLLFVLFLKVPVPQELFLR